MANEIAELLKAQSDYQVAVEECIAAIREDKRLASAILSVAEIDSWERAGMRAEEARKKAQAARKTYRDALRREFFHF